MPDDFDTAFEAAWSGGDTTASEVSPKIETPSDTGAAPVAADTASVAEPKSAVDGRDEKGRFIQKAAVDPAAKSAADPVAAKGVPAATSPVPGSAVSPPDYAAGRLTAEEKGLLDKLQPEAAVLVRQVLARQEAVHTRRMQEVAEGRKAFTAIENVLAPRRATWAKHGTSDVQAINNLFQVEDAFMRDPRGTLEWLAKIYNVNLGAAAADPATDQTVNQPWQGEVAGLRTTVQQLQQQLQATQQATIGQQVVALDRLVTQFQASHPHKDYLPLVEDRIPGLITQLRATQPELSHEELLTQAYEAALWANPQTRAVLIDGQLAASRASTSDAAKVHAQKARIAGSSVNGGVALSGPAAKSSLSDIISSALSDL